MEVKRVKPRTLSGFMELMPKEQIEFNKEGSKKLEEIRIRVNRPIILRNCNNEIDDSAEFCPICNVYVSTCQVATQEIHTKQTFVLVLENGAKFDIQPEVNTTVTIGRADLSSRPDIDLGPYDDGPYISRLQGEFFDKNGVEIVLDQHIFKGGFVIIPD